MISILSLISKKQITLKNGETVAVGDKLSAGIIPDIEITNITDTDIEVYSCYTSGKYLVAIDKFVNFSYHKIY